MRASIRNDRCFYRNVNCKNAIMHLDNEIDGVKVIVRDKGSVKAPEFSHTANRIYAVVQDGKLKHLNLDHSDSGIPLSAEEEKLVKKIKRRIGLS